MTEGLWVVIIGGLFGLASLWYQHRLNRSTKQEVQQDITQRIGVPNGKGNVVEMLEKLLDEKESRLLWQENTSKRLDNHERRLIEVERPWP
jgi:hypothetical protein